jgi:hypothetical protein
LPSNVKPAYDIARVVGHYYLRFRTSGIERLSLLLTWSTPAGLVEIPLVARPTREQRAHVHPQPQSVPEQPT